MVKGNLPWHVVEEAINKEITWLKTVIVQARLTGKPGCDVCPYTYRKIALLILTGKVKATEIKPRQGHDLWDDLTIGKDLERLSRHGGVWHVKMMDVLRAYFSKLGFEIIDEPFLAMGRADLGVYKKGHIIKHIYFRENGGRLGVVGLERNWMAEA